MLKFCLRFSVSFNGIILSVDLFQEVQVLFLKYEFTKKQPARINTQTVFSEFTLMAQVALRGQIQVLFVDFHACFHQPLIMSAGRFLYDPLIRHTGQDQLGSHDTKRCFFCRQTQ